MNWTAFVRGVQALGPQPTEDDVFDALLRAAETEGCRGARCG